MHEEVWQPRGSFINEGAKATKDLNFSGGAGRYQRTVEPIEGYLLSYWVLKGITNPGPVNLIISGVHPTEIVARETVRRLPFTIDVNDLTGTTVILPIINTEGVMQNIERYFPQDQKDFNRAFPGDPNGTFTSRLMYWLHEQQVKIVAQNNNMLGVFIDCHSYEKEHGIPLAFCIEGSSNSQRLANSSGLQFTATVPRSGNTTIHSAEAAGISAITLEVGDENKFRESDHEIMKNAILRILCANGSLATKVNVIQPTIVSAHSIVAPIDGMWTPNIAPGESFAKEQVLGFLTPLNYGEDRGQPVRAPVEGVVLYLAQAHIWVRSSVACSGEIGQQGASSPLVVYGTVV